MIESKKELHMVSYNEKIFAGKLILRIKRMTRSVKKIELVKTRFDIHNRAIKQSAIA